MTSPSPSLPRVPVIVCAKNEARAITYTVEALLRGRAFARDRFDLEIGVVLDDTTDESERVLRGYDGVVVARSSGGKVEAQRTGLATMRARAGEREPWAVFCDADVIPSDDALLALSSLLAERPEVRVATCPLEPVAPRRHGPLARALHTYNRRRGFSSSRTWFNGKLFAIRDWCVPTPGELAERASKLPHDPFYDYEAGIVIDDIFLSRAIVAGYGPGAIAETREGVVRYRAPETWRGMNRYYKRMRRELERLDRLLPETADVHRTHGRRRQDLLEEAPLHERLHHAIFAGALLSCRAAYVAERAWVRHVTRAPRAWWRPIEETKAW
ncbi:MAG: glycosyltransferase family 2 protein [Deltaproteobacteria bacterium]|nr:glycosyltransferase family 2 protein [Deltaproteobacteria bacterium]